jgi:hypothetical protein
LSSQDVSPSGIVIDGSGNVWVPEYETNHQLAGIFEYSPTGSIISPSVGYRYGNITHATSIAIDGSGNVWFVDSMGTNVVSELVGAATPVVTPLAVAVKNNTIASRP